MSLPVSFSALRTFVEVGRHGSIKRAAQHLNVTPGAVSQQVKVLEERFGVQLLERGNREIRLSQAGLQLFGEIAPGFDQIEFAVERLDDRRPGPRSLVVSTTPSFAACWLAPRLGSFTAMHPDIEVRIETSVQLADMRQGRVDVALRHGSGRYVGLEATQLFAPELVAVASPSLLADGPLADVRGCLRYPLLQDRDRADWVFWFEANGLDPPPAASKGPSYADDALLIQAAAAGQGLAVVRDVYAARALDAGDIMLAVDAPVPMPAKYFFVVAPERAKGSKVVAFREWITGEADAA